MAIFYTNQKNQNDKGTFQILIYSINVEVIIQNIITFSLNLSHSHIGQIKTQSTIFEFMSNSFCITVDLYLILLK